MDDNDIQFAVKRYKKAKSEGDYTIEEFYNDIVEHLQRRPMPFCTYDPFGLMNSVRMLWETLEMSMAEVVERSKMDMAKFSRRFVIPYRTVQAWCDGTNECPVYIKMMICEILGFYRRIVRFDMNGRRV
jgi:hypothetical protein